MSDRSDIYTYKRNEYSPVFNRQPARNRSSLSIPGLLRDFTGLISPGMLLACMAAFFMGRAVILGELFPFSAAFAAASAVSMGRKGFLPVISLIGGISTVSGGYDLAANIILTVLSYFVIQAVPPRYTDRRAVIPVLVLGLVITVKSSFTAFSGSTPFDYINIFFEGIFAGVLAPVCITGLSSASRINGIKPLRGEEAVCLVILLAGVIAGTGDLGVWHVSARGLLSRIAILLAALAGGAGLGAAAGAVVGVIPGLSYTVTPYLVGAYSFSGVLAGLGGSLGKLGISLSFLASNIILALYFNNFESMEAVVLETSLACLIFMLIPGYMVGGISATVSGNPPGYQEDNSRELLRKAFREKLKEFSFIFREMAGQLGEFTVIHDKKLDDEGLRKIMGQVSKKVCGDCGMHRVCWESDYYRTYQNMLEMFAITEVNGRVTVRDIPEELKMRCSRPRDLAVAAACLYEAFKIDRHWRKKLMAGKSTVGEQLKGIAAVFDSLGSEFDFNMDDRGYSDMALLLKLRQLGIPVNEIIINDFRGRREMVVSMRSCKGDLDCRYRVAPVISELAGQLFCASGCFCEGTRQGLCKFRLYQGPNYKIEVGAAVVGREGEEVSGDVYDFLQLKDGKFAAVLSDGMGSGPDAARESSSAVNILRKMLEAGLNIEQSVKTVNAVQALKNPEESFAAMDMTIVNLYSGQGEFIKTAAPPTYIIRGGRLISIRSSSLPVGILSEIDINIVERKLASGDVIVMLTDGILSSRRATEDGEEWITGVLRELNGLEPREMAQLLIKLAQTGSGGGDFEQDDMAVLVIKVEREKVVEIPL